MKNTCEVSGDTARHAGLVSAGQVTRSQNQGRNDVVNIILLRNATLAGLLALGLALPALAQDLRINPDDVKPPQPEYSPYVEHNYPGRCVVPSARASLRPRYRHISRPPVAGTTP